MTDVGIVGLDTSHAESFANLITKRLSGDLTAVWDGETVRSESYRQQFCTQYGATAYEDPHEMIGDVDAAMILTVDWNAHSDLAVPFLENDVPILVDKPIAGRLQEIDALRTAADETPIFGGSAVAYHPELSELASQHRDQTLYCVGYNDQFYYGVHLVDSLCRIVGETWACVSPADDPGQTVDIVFSDGAYATIRLDNTEDMDQFSFLSIGNRPRSVSVGSSKSELENVYEPYLNEFFDVIDGTTDVSDRVLTAAELLLAVDAALEYNRPITPGCKRLADHHVESGEFVKTYQSNTYVSKRIHSSQKTD